MTQQLIAAGFLAAALTALGAGKPEKNPLMSSDSVVWAGLDYSKVKIIGAAESLDPAYIIPGMFDEWNRLFIIERMERVRNLLKKRVLLDTNGVAERNKTASIKQIVQSPGPDDVLEKSHITDKDIADAVRSYKLQKTNGLGLVFIVDRLVKGGRQSVPATLSGRHAEVHSADRAKSTITRDCGAVYITFFDVASRSVIASERVIHPPGGGGFRNYWFAVIKRTESDLSKYR